MTTKNPPLSLRRFALAGGTLCVAALVAGCAAPPQSESRVAPPVSEDVAPARAAVPEPDRVLPPTLPVSTNTSGTFQWKTAHSNAGNALFLDGQLEPPLLHLACLPQPARMVVTVANFVPLAGGEQLSLELDGQVYRFMPDATGAAHAGVRAQAAIPAAMLTQLPDTRLLNVRYGDQRLDGITAPSHDTAQDFAKRCVGVSVPKGPTP